MRTKTALSLDVKYGLTGTLVIKDFFELKKLRISDFEFANEYLRSTIVILKDITSKIAKTGHKYNTVYAYNPFLKELVQFDLGLFEDAYVNKYKLHHSTKLTESEIQERSVMSMITRLYSVIEYMIQLRMDFIESYFKKKNESNRCDDPMLQFIKHPLVVGTAMAWLDPIYRIEIEARHMLYDAGWFDKFNKEF